MSFPLPTEEVLLEAKPPFDFHLTAGYQTYFLAESGADVYADGVYRRLVEIGGRPRLLALVSEGEGRLRLRVTGANLAADDLGQAQQVTRWLLATDLDLSGFYAMAQQEPLLERLVQLCHGLHPPRAATVFEGLVLAIAGQQISGVVARQLRTRLIQTFGPTLEVDGRRYFGFPSPPRLAPASENALRHLGFSERKAEYILALARAASVGTLDLDGLRLLEDDQVVERLLPLRGVGQWTVDWLLARALGRPDAFPTGDLALRRTISHLYFGGQEISAAQAGDFAQRWAPFRALATAYIFAALRQGIVLSPPKGILP